MSLWEGYSGDFAESIASEAFVEKLRALGVPTRVPDGPQMLEYKIERPDGPQIVVQFYMSGSILLPTPIADLVMKTPVNAFDSLAPQGDGVAWERGFLNDIAHLAVGGPDACTAWLVAYRLRSEH